MSSLREIGARVEPLPYERLKRLAPRAKWLRIDVDKIAACVDLVEAGVTNLVRLDTRETRAPTRQYLDEEAVQTMGRLGKSAKWAAWTPGE